MEFDLVFLSDMSLTEWGRYLYQLLQTLNIDAAYHVDHGSICCAYFTFFLDMDEDLGMEYYQEVYSFEANVEVGIQMIGSVSDIGIEVLFKMLRLIIEEKTDNFMLVDNCGRIILKREKDVFCKSNTFESYGKHGTNFPYTLLGREIKEV